jgi:hypothetical protein
MDSYTFTLMVGNPVRAGFRLRRDLSGLALAGSEQGDGNANARRSAREDDVLPFTCVVEALDAERPGAALADYATEWSDRRRGPIDDGDRDRSPGP